MLRMHTGEAIKEAENFYGRRVILAARIADKAEGGQILVSSLLKELTESAGDIRFGEGREVELKGHRPPACVRGGVGGLMEPRIQYAKTKDGVNPTFYAMPEGARLSACMLFRMMS